MVSGCSQKDLEPENNSEDLEREYNDMQGITKNNTSTEQTKKESTSDNHVTTSTKTEKKTSTPTKTESCNHPSVTTKYVGLDKATGKIIYDTYCSKCGEYLGRVKY